LLVGREQSSGWLAFGAELGLALDFLRFQGQSVPNPDSSFRLNPGLRWDGFFRLRASRRLQAELVPSFAFFPRTYVVRVEPATSLAETPRWWIGIGLGLKYSLWSE
jgi:hypothetical protein